MFCQLRLFHLYVPMIFVSWCLCGVAYLCHYNYGETRIDAPLTAFQAFNGITVFAKVYVFELLLGYTHLNLRFYAIALVAVMFAIQWLIVPEIFILAPIPYVHSGVELLFVCEAAMVLSLWQSNYASPTHYRIEYAVKCLIFSFFAFLLEHNRLDT